MTARLGAIADDYTGATDLAVALRRAGLRTLLFFGPPDAGEGRAGESAPDGLAAADAIVVGLKSRTIPAAEAVALSVRAAAWLRAAGAEQLYFKYCSTFDSTPSGNIGPVLDALRQLVDPDGDAAPVLTTPASPEHGRTVYAGHLFVHDVLLAETHMSRHPLTPMTDSFLPRVLAAQTPGAVAVLPQREVSRGASAIGAALRDERAAGTRYVLADAIDEGSLAALAVAVADAPLVAGAAGLGGALAAVRAERASAAPAAGSPPARGRGAILSGSCSLRTREQLEQYVLAGGPAHRLDLFSESSPSALAEEALRWFDAQADGRAPVIYSTLPPEELRRVQQAFGTERSAELLETAMGLIAAGLRERGVGRLVVAGGETSGAVVDALGIRGVRIGEEAARGVPWIETLGADPLWLLLKSGNFGEPDLFLRAVAGGGGRA